MSRAVPSSVVWPAPRRHASWGDDLRALLAAAALVCVTAHASDARAESDAARRKQAQALFDEGLKLAQKGDVEGALTAFRDAHARFPSYKMLYNIGQLCVRAGDAPCAVRAFEQYLKDGGKDVPAKRKSEVEAEVRSLSKTLGRITIRVDVAGAEVSVDREVVGKSPLPEAVLVRAGSHTVAAKAGSRAAEKAVKVASATSETVSLELAASAAPPPVEAAPEKKAEAPEAAPAPASTTAAPEEPSLVPWYVAGGFAAGTIVSSILFAVAYSSYGDTRERYPITREELDASHGRARDYLLLTGAFGAATLVSTGVASFITLASESPEPPKNAEPPNKKGATRPTTRFGLGGHGVVLRGEF